MRIRFAPRRGLPANRAETAAKFAAGYRENIPLNWKRDGNLIRKGKPNKPKPNSSVGKIGRTRVSGADKTLKDFRTLVRTLQRLQQEHGHKGGHKALQQAYKGVRKQVSATVKGKGVRKRQSVLKKFPKLWELGMPPCLDSNEELTFRRGTDLGFTTRGTRYNKDKTEDFLTKARSFSI